MDSRQAAKRAGYSDSFAKVAHYRLQKKPAIAREIDAIRAEGRQMAVYDLARAMREAQDVIDFSKKHKYSMAYFKAVEHRAKLSGLLTDRIQLDLPDLRGALQAAQYRVFGNISPVMVEHVETKDTPGGAEPSRSQPAEQHDEHGDERTKPPGNAQWPRHV
jgi:hypothetical protein